MSSHKPRKYTSEVEQDRLFRAIVEESFDVVSVIDESTRFLYVSPSIERVLGYTPSELIGRESIDFMRPELRNMLLENHRAALEQPDYTGVVEAETRHKNGSWRTIEFAMQNRLDDPDIRGVVVNYRDITDRKRWQEALQESEERYQKAFNSSPDSIAISRLRDGVFLDVNESFERMTGFGREEMIGRSSLDLHHWKDTGDRDRLTRLLQTQGSVREFQAEFLHRDGSIRVGQLSVELFEFGGERCMLASIRDITETVTALQELERATEMLRRDHAELEEKHDELQDLLQRIQERKNLYRHEITASVDNLLRPLFRRLRSSGGRLHEDDVTRLEHRIGMIAHHEASDPDDSLARLTPRERGICELIRQGLSSRQIAHELGLSPETVNKHRQSIRRKLQIDHRGINLTTFLRS